MPGNYNRVILAGNLTRDVEMRFLESGMGVAKFTIAINRKTKKGDETIFVDIVAWDKLAEICNTYLKKGASVLVEGRLAIRSYDDKDGNKRKATEVVIDAMQMLGGRKDNDQAQPQGNRESGSYDSGGTSNQATLYDDDLAPEIPF